MRKGILLALVFFVGLVLGAQGTIAATYSQGQYASCLSLCEKQLVSAPLDSLALYFQGLCLLQLEDYETALESLRAANENGYQPAANCEVQQAVCLTQLAQEEEALRLLQKLVNNGFANYQALTHDGFEPLKKEEAFKTLQDSVHRRAFPCYYDPNYTHFDFWVGNWNVFVGNVKVGENIITKQEGGCALLEQYTTARDYVGQSINFFDPSDGRWKQFWIDKSQGLTKYVETERKPGYLQFVSGPGSVPTSFGTLRMTFTLREDGTVRQHMEQQQEANSDWQTVFDGRYVRQE